MTSPLHIYADQSLGAMGWEEKPWMLPHVRNDAFIEEFGALGLGSRVMFQTAAAATDEQLSLFHTQDHVARMRAACATNRGCLDDPNPHIANDARRILKSLGVDDASTVLSSVKKSVAARLCPAMTFEGYVDYLESCHLLERSDDNHRGKITAKGKAFLSGDTALLGGVTYARVGVERAARHIVGAVLDATRRIVDGQFDCAFVPIAGFHHAHADQARMYCLYNDPAVAITWLLTQIEGNVAYVDIDIHQGDGVYTGFAHEPRVRIVDLHEDWSTMFPFTPDQPGRGPFTGRASDTGLGRGEGTKLNVPLAPHTTDAAYIDHWNATEQFIRDAQPKFIVFESGADGLAADPTSNQCLTGEAISHVTRRVKALAQECAGGRLLVLGGGGYDVEGTSKAWASVAQTLIEAEA